MKPYAAQTATALQKGAVAVEMSSICDVEN
jgi:hypothetical protein